MDLKGIQKTFRNTHAQHRPYAKTLTLAMKMIKQGGQRVDEPALIIVWMRGVRSSTREHLNFFSLKKKGTVPQKSNLIKKIMSSIVLIIQNAFARIST